MNKLAKKSFALYCLTWFIALGLFNVITFVTPEKIDGVSKYTSSFWLAYILITVTLLIQLAVSLFVFRENSQKKAFYRISLIKIGISSLILMFVVGSLTMALPTLPNWIGIIACCVVLAFYIIAAAKALMAITPIEEIDKKVKIKTFFIKMLTADAEILVCKTENQELKPIVQKVYEAVRYSDPMSDDALSPVEEKISTAFGELSEAVEQNDTVAAEAHAKRLLMLLTERNAKCKVLK